MTKEEHIRFLIRQSHDDIGATEALRAAGYYGHALFWAHLVLEKICKALWVYKNNNVDYPYIHNLLRLLKESDVELSNDQVEFYAEMNQFQSEGRYADSLKKIENTVTQEICSKFIEKSKTEMQWLLKQMPEILL